MEHHFSFDKITRWATCSCGCWALLLIKHEPEWMAIDAHWEHKICCEKAEMVVVMEVAVWEME